jgi:hypothetical protein
MNLDETASAIRKDRTNFERLLVAIEKEALPARKIKIAKKALALAVEGSTSHYSSDVLEKVFLALAERHSVLDLSASFSEDHYLHVMTQCYAVGGHTRVVERWIELAPKGQSHSLVLTGNERQEVPERLQQAVIRSGGTITCLPDAMTELDKGLALRRIGARQALVILHTHMHDVVPIIAFGAEQFSRPVLLYNHADHRFWVGVSIADMVAETRHWGRELSLNKRGVKCSEVLGIPQDLSACLPADKAQLRKAHDLPANVPLILTVGAPHKYKPLGRMDFLAFARALLTACEQAILVAVGPSFRALPEWKSAADRLGGRILAVGPKPPSVLREYIGACDLAIDSFPMSGGTALGDLVSAGCPVLALRCPTGHVDFVMNTEAYCEDADELIAKANVFLTNKPAAQQSLYKVRSKFEIFSGPKGWSQRLERILWNIPKRHQILHFRTPPADSPSDLDAFLYISSSASVKKHYLSHIFALGRIVTAGKRRLN